MASESCNKVLGTCLQLKSVRNCSENWEQTADPQERLKEPPSVSEELSCFISFNFFLSVESESTCLRHNCFL